MYAYSYRGGDGGPSGGPGPSGQSARSRDKGAAPGSMGAGDILNDKRRRGPAAFCIKYNSLILNARVSEK